jgi:hypothetical protein
MRLLGAAIIFLLALTAQGQPGCQGQPVPAGNNVTFDVTMRAQPGSTCTYRFYFSAGPTTGYRIVEHPMHGKAWIDPIHVFYRAPAGYLGTDEFMYERSGLTALHQPNVRRVRVHVTVSQSL